jgi:hypothetical protein
MNYLPTRNPLLDIAEIANALQGFNKTAQNLVSARKKRDQLIKHGITFVNGYPDNTPKETDTPTMKDFDDLAAILTQRERKNQ